VYSSQQDYVLFSVKPIAQVRFLKFEHKQICYFSTEKQTLLKALNTYDKVIVHYMTPAVAKFLSAVIDKNFSLIWILWGGDFYFLPQFRKQIYDSFALKNSSKRKEFFFDSVRGFFNIPSMKDVTKIYSSNMIDYCATYISQDYHLFKQAFSQNQIKYLDFTYQAQNQPLLSVAKQKTAIIVGNSADSGGNHSTIIDLLVNKRVSSKVVVPLSYGDKLYAQKIAEYGKACLGQQFSPLTVFLDKTEYSKILSEIGYAIYNNPYQQGAGNVIHLLNLGVKVFLRKENTLLTFFRSLGIVVFDIEDDLLQANSLSENLPLLVARENSAIINRFFSEQNLQKRFHNLYT
jgi:hypothetical protein